MSTWAGTASAPVLSAKPAGRPGRRRPACREKLAVEEATQGAGAVGLDPDEQAGNVGSRFVMRIRLSVEVFNHPAAARWRIHRLKAGGERFCRRHPAQRQDVASLQERFDGPAELGPILDLARDGAFGHSASKPSVQNEAVRESYRLTHSEKVPKRYSLSTLLSHLMASPQRRRRRPAPQNNLPLRANKAEATGSGTGSATISGR
jgi:hypothetical protein